VPFVHFDRLGFLLVPAAKSVVRAANTSSLRRCSRFSIRLTIWLRGNRNTSAIFQSQLADSTEGERRFRSERERHSGPKANGVRSVATLAIRLWSKHSRWSRETCPERGEGSHWRGERGAGKGAAALVPALAMQRPGEHQLDGCVPRFLRMESPRISMRCALWTRRSRMPSAAVGSPICSCQRATGNCEVRIVERV